MYSAKRNHPKPSTPNQDNTECSLWKPSLNETYCDYEQYNREETSNDGTLVALNEGNNRETMNWKKKIQR